MEHGVWEGPVFGVDIKGQDPRMPRDVLWGTQTFSTLVYITSLPTGSSVYV